MADTAVKAAAEAAEVVAEAAGTKTLPSVDEHYQVVRLMSITTTPKEQITDKMRELVANGWAPINRAYLTEQPSLDSETPGASASASAGASAGAGAGASAGASAGEKREREDGQGGGGKRAKGLDGGKRDPAERAGSKVKVAGEAESGGGFGARKKKMDAGMRKSGGQRQPRMCLSYVSGLGCSYGDKCKRSHDVAGLVGADRVPDLVGECPNVATEGFCRFGLLCRFGLSHASYDADTGVLFNAGADAYTGEEEGAARYAAFGDEVNVVTPKEFRRVTRKSAETPRADKAFAVCDDDYFDFVTARATVTGLPDAEDPRSKVDFTNKLYLAPLTTLGHLPFRRLCKSMGADITCGEMAVVQSLLKAKQQEWALLRAHKDEDVFGVQLCTAWPNDMARVCEAINSITPQIDFVDLNVCCPIDLVFNKGMGSALLDRKTRLLSVVRAGATVLDIPLTVKMRTGVGRPMVDTLIPDLKASGVAALSIHGRTRSQRYSKFADWEYMIETARESELPVIGNGDIFSYAEADAYMKQPGLTSIMVARGALVKPWIFTELKESRHWDISAQERWALFEEFVRFGLRHWGSDARGVEKTRRYLLEWLSFTHRYIPVGVLDVLPQQMTLRPPSFVGRNDLETLLASPNAQDWVTITERLLGPVPDGFKFVPKHKSNAYPDEVQG